MAHPLSSLRAALLAYEREDRFSEADYLALRSVLAGALGPRRGAADLLDGLISLFFERQCMHPGRRAELLAMDDDALGRALRHRFRQLVAGESDDRRPFHALQGHVREALDALADTPPRGEVSWPVSLRGRHVFVQVQVE